MTTTDKTKKTTTTTAKKAVKQSVAPAAAKPAAAPKPRTKLEIREGTRLRDAAGMMKLKPRDLLALLNSRNVKADIDDFVDEKSVELITGLTNYDLEFLTVEEATKRLAEKDPDKLVPRPPIVTIMGHVDHGKTTLLDAIRSSSLVDKEFGGITQHIGAYRVKVKDRIVTFIDTPGHEAFTRLRARGAKVTDIVILVVAADDGIMPQTKEAIDHAKAAEVPIIVAINKIDKPEANIDRVKQQLSKEGLLIEEWGGKTICVEISAKENKNVKELLEMITLLGDILELKANPKVPAQGVVLEARMDNQRGPMATVLIQQGSLASGQSFVSGLACGKIRALFDETGKPIKSAGPSSPVEIMGFSEVPTDGDIFQITPTQAAAKLVVEFRKSRVVPTSTERPESRLSLDELFKKIEEGATPELNLIVKADVQGSVEVLNDLIPTLQTDKVKVNIIHSSTGTISEADILLATASKGVVIGYNVKVQPKIMDMAKKEGIEIRLYKIIYQLTDDIKKAVVGLLEPEIREVFLGRAEVRKVFQIPKIGTIAGCYVKEGRITRSAEIKIVRNGKVIIEGRISSLKHMKENVNEVKKEYECGIGVDKFHDFEPGDMIEAYTKEKVRPTA